MISFFIACNCFKDWQDWRRWKTFLISISSSNSSLNRFFYKFINDLKRFFTICSVRFSFNYLDIFDHFLPLFITLFINSKSSFKLHELFNLLGSKWFIQCSRHCFGVLKYFLSDSKNNDFAISFHLFLTYFYLHQYILYSIMEVRIVASSGVHFLDLRVDFRRNLLWY